jgi:DNA-directed RNA polymerase specialized sigma24 family protein
MTNEPTSATALTCAGCTSQLTRFQTGLLEEADTAVVQEHLDSCPSCRLFSDQIDVVVDFVGSGEPTDIPESVSNLLDDFAASAADRSNDPADVVRSLCRLADSLDPDGAEDLVQQTLLTALEDNGGDLELSVLAQQLTDRAFDDSGPMTRSLDDYSTRIESRKPGLDPDGDTAELFYPEFYSSGPDSGRHVNAPNRWGPTNSLSPDEDVLTAELYGAVDDALSQLDDPLGQLVQLIDIDGVPLADAAQALRLDENDAVDGLHRARIHLRGVVASLVDVRS